MRAAFSTRSLISALGIFCNFSAKAMLSRTVRCGYSAYDWNTMAMSRSFGSRSLTTRSPMRSSPDEIVSSPAIIRRAVDLPQPDGPTSTRNSPSATSSESLCTAWNPFSYTLSISSSAMLLTAAPSAGGSDAADSCRRRLPLCHTELLC